MHHHPARQPGAALLRHLQRLKAVSLAALPATPVLRLAACSAIALATPIAPLHAQENATGTITGRVFNVNSGTYLTNARVTVEGTSIQAFTDDSGTYFLRNVPAGENKIVISYTGQDNIVKSVKVDQGGTARIDANFNAGTDGEAVTLDTFVIEAARYRNAQELAVNEERVSNNIKSVVALDSLGYVADGNVGEFVRYLPGVDISEGGAQDTSNPTNATTVGVRGFGGSDTDITIDGMPIASGAGSLTRAVQLDGLSVNNASRLEIIKVATPDMPQNAPGGSINLITRGAFEARKPSYDITTTLIGNTNEPNVFKKEPGPDGPMFKTRTSVRLSATIPISNTFGLSLSASNDPKYTMYRTGNLRDYRYTANSTTVGGVATPTTNALGGIRLDNPLAFRYELRDQQWVEDRQSGSIRADWRPFPSLEIRAGGTYSQQESKAVIRRTQWQFSNNGRDVSDWGNGFVRSRPNTPHSVDQTVDARDKEGFTTQANLSVAYKKGPWKVDLKASASESYHTLPDTQNGHFSTLDARLSVARMSWEGITDGKVGQILVWDASGNPINYQDISKWGGIGSDAEIRSSQNSSRDLKRDYKLDVSRELDFLPFPVTIKAGVNQREQSNRRWGRGDTYKMTYIGPSIPAASVASEFTTEAKYGYTNDQQWVDTYKLFEIYKQRPDYFSDTFRRDAVLDGGGGNVDRNIGNYLARVGTKKGVTTTDKDWYGMLTASFFNNRLTVVTGGRQSRKEVNGYNVFNDPRAPFVRMADGSIYTDSIYTKGVRFDGGLNTGYTTPSMNSRYAVLNDTALRSRMAAAGVAYLPNALALGYASPAADVANPNANKALDQNGIWRYPGTGSEGNGANMLLAQLTRYTRDINTARTQPFQPQLQVAYNITDSLKLQVAYSKETRMPDLDGTNGILNGGSFTISQNADWYDGAPDEVLQGRVTVGNSKNQPEVNHSFNGKLAYYAKYGRYSISYYHKYVEKAWRTEIINNDDSEYGTFMSALGLDPTEYYNYEIQTIASTGEKAIRKGFELEVTQNLGFVGAWASGIDFFASYTRRPTVARTENNSIRGYIRQDPVRAKYTGGLSYSRSRFSIQSKFTYVEQDPTQNSGSISANLPDMGTTAFNVATFNPNYNPATVSLQANYILNKYLKFFVSGNRILESKKQVRTIDSIGVMPEWATYRQFTEQGVQIAAGATLSF
ncbi:hypothetical protein CMV30_06910 [Nibricoccus aquaticus]|uniref:TonB-dependent receptor plug domain-containing protein n=1 Tax=Nibricoccus aquaticus TaxID=2576891 RepID=A0A290Q5D2_9BACT|nr:TonB-dependent receptor [Nibricoccus aquaticus]ATC63704.1 hypothetical protein CMV30_06910 [Nibricoccus aquaticus]